MKTDLVPCFYMGQNFRVDEPAERTARAIVREYKAKGRGKFVDSGRAFLFHARGACRSEAPRVKASARTILHYMKTNCYGDKLHYEIPRAGDAGPFARHRRKFIRVSGRLAPELRPELRIA